MYNEFDSYYLELKDLVRSCRHELIPDTATSIYSSTEAPRTLITRWRCRVCRYYTVEISETADRYLTSVGE